jgi:hypothetical protein
MARRTLIWHIGLADAPRAVVGTTLEAHREALDALGLRVVATAEESRLATHEVLRTHRDAGLARADVEGVWARIVDRVWRHRGVSLLSTPDLCVADKDELRFALDQLVDVEVHLVVTVDSVPAQLYGAWLARLREGRTTGWDKHVRRVLADPVEHRQAERYWAGHALPDVLARWSWTLRPERVHVVATADPAEQWSTFLDVAGVATADQPAPVVGAAVVPVVETPELLPVLARWTETVVAAGHRLHGDLTSLAVVEAPAPLPGDQLGLTEDALGDALAENARLRGELAVLRAENERLERKRRKLRKKLDRRAAG